VAGLAIALIAWQPWAGPSVGRSARAAVAVPAPARPSEAPYLTISREQQEAIGLKTATIEEKSMTAILRAPGRVTPDESRYAFITPRAGGVVRSVAAQIGLDVKAGDILAVIDSPQVAQARLDLVSRSQELDVARAQASWQEAIYRTTNELIEQLKANASPGEIHKKFEDRPIGETRERLITAYATYRLARVTLERNKELQEKGAIALSQYQQVEAEFESALAVYEGLMDRMGFEATLAYTRASQASRQAETALRVAVEQLRVLGIPAGDAELQAAEARMTAAATRPPATLIDAVKAAESMAARPSAAMLGDTGQPVSTYELRAPFDATILDRGVVVPGVPVDTTHQVFTVADLSKVWVEASVHESDFSMLEGTRGGKVTIRTRAYPGRAFAGTVLYTGDLVDEKSRMVKLLASAANDERSLKPGMYVEVEIESQAAPPAPTVPDTALLTEGADVFVFVRVSEDRFERRAVTTGTREDGRVLIRSGLKVGEEVVIEGGFKLKSEAMRLANG
jgi:Cu(I)/Ag(I) efflux system membrane fusion protein